MSMILYPESPESIMFCYTIVREVAVCRGMNESDTQTAV